MKTEHPQYHETYDRVKARTRAGIEARKKAKAEAQATANAKANAKAKAIATAKHKMQRATKPIAKGNKHNWKTNQQVQTVSNTNGKQSKTCTK